MPSTIRHNGVESTSQYQYNGMNQLMAITYPSGRVVNYQRYPNGRI